MQIIILVEHLPKFNQEIHKVNKRAEKLGLAGYTVKENFRFFKIVHESGLEAQFVNLEIEGSAPYIKGWELIGVLDFSEGLPIPHSVPGKEIPAELRESEAICEHCNLERIRKEIVILRNHENKEYKRVGLSCVKDFLPGANIEQIVGSLKQLRSIEELKEEYESLGYHSGSSYFNIERVLQVSSAIIRKDGWLSKGKQVEQGGVASADLVLEYLCGKNEEWKKERDPIELDYQIAEKTLNWIKNDLSGEAEYGYKLKLIAELERVSFKNIGIVVSAIASYQKHVGEELSKQQRKNEWFGEIGERYKGLVLIVKHIKYLNGSYGVTSLISLEDNEKRQYVWFASGEHIYEIGKEIEVDISVKEHKEYNGFKQTVLTRGKISK